jgi:acyl-CoA hydrolase
MSNCVDEYQQKLTTATEAVKVVKDGDMIVYSPFAVKTSLLDEALAFRKMELHDITVLFATLTYMPEIVKADPEGEVFKFTDGSFSAVTRGIKSMGVPIYAVPSLFHESGIQFTAGAQNADILFLAVGPMDENGNFNLGPESSFTMDCIKARGGYKRNLKVLAEVDPKLPYVYGDTTVNISEIDYVIENAEGQPPLPIGEVRPTEIDKKIATLIMNEMVDGACIQFGIGGLPNIVGEMLADSDFKDLGCHSEMYVDAYMKLEQAGRLTNKRKQIDVGKSVFTFAMGSEEMYRYIDRNPNMACKSVTYTNNPSVIAQNDRVYSICSGISVDMLGNVSSESVGYRQISGTGGQLDYHLASMHSKGGKGFICLPSTRTDRKGNVTSNVVVSFPMGTQITVPANMTNYIVTEYGVVNLKGCSTWDRVEKLISITHPDFREDIIKAAEKAKIWRQSNKITA